MAKYIDADKLLEEMSVNALPRDAQRLYLAMRGMVRNAPTADVVEVVRCKDCKHRVGNSKMCAHPKAIGWDAIEPEDDDFCNYGEKRSEEE